MWIYRRWVNRRFRSLSSKSTFLILYLLLYHIFRDSGGLHAIITMKELIERILEVDFDERVAKGDASLGFLV